jgi:hypothetical protein
MPGIDDEGRDWSAVEEYERRKAAAMKVETRFGKSSGGWWWGVWQGGFLVGFGACYKSKQRCFKHQNACLERANKVELPTVDCENPDVMRRN